MRSKCVQRRGNMFRKNGDTFCLMVVLGDDRPASPPDGCCGTPDAEGTTNLRGSNVTVGVALFGSGARFAGAQVSGVWCATLTRWRPDSHKHGVCTHGGFR